MYLPFSGLGFECGLYVKHLKHGFISEDQNNLRVGDYVMKVRNQIYYCDGKPLGLVIGQYLQAIQFLRFTVIAVIFMKAIRHVFVWVYSRESSRVKTRGMLGRAQEPCKVISILLSSRDQLNKTKTLLRKYCCGNKGFLRSDV